MAQFHLRGLPPRILRSNFSALLRKAALSVPICTARGAAIAFDSSFPHAAYNDDADDAAHVLLVDFWHPDLSGAEIDALRAFGDCIERHIARCQVRGEHHAATP